ncbi:unnamed protein product [Amoebophrya sp. A120]|nr:unnamed protein product [Amoebophrya sp. A120]|eukprot:GSA120T00003840001.1
MRYTPAGSEIPGSAYQDMWTWLLGGLLQQIHGRSTTSFNHRTAEQVHDEESRTVHEHALVSSFTTQAVPSGMKRRHQVKARASTSFAIVPSFIKAMTPFPNPAKLMASAGPMMNNALVKIPQMMGLSKQAGINVPTPFEDANWWRYDYKGKYKLGSKLRYEYLKVERCSLTNSAKCTHRKRSSLTCTGADQCRQKCFEKIAAMDQQVTTENYGTAKTAEQRAAEKLAQENKGRKLRGCLDEVDRRERNAMHNYFQYTVGTQGLPCGSFCSQRIPNMKIMRKIEDGLVKYGRKIEYVKFQMDSLKKQLPAKDAPDPPAHFKKPAVTDEATPEATEELEPEEEKELSGTDTFAWFKKQREELYDKYAEAEKKMDAILSGGGMPTPTPTGDMENGVTGGNGGDDEPGEPPVQPPAGDDVDE